MRRWQIWTVAGIFLVCLLVPLTGQNDYILQWLFRIFLFAAMGLAWNLVGGYAGQLSLGHAAFFGVGAYGLALFVKAGLPAWPSLLLAALVATIFAATMGIISFRLRGPYFTLSTIAFAEMLRLLATNLKITEGAIGITMPALFSGPYFWAWFYTGSVLLAGLAMAVNRWVSRSKFGYYLMAIREDEETAMAVGVDPSRYKLWTLLLSAFLTALGGAIYGSAFQFIVPDSILSLSISVQIAIIAMLGGAGTVVGPLVGSVILLTASELFQNAFQGVHLLIYGVLIVVVVLFLPEGIVGSIGRRLHRWRLPPAAARKVHAGTTHKA